MRNFLFAFFAFALTGPLIAGSASASNPESKESHLKVLSGEELEKAYVVDKKAARELNTLLANRLASFLACPKNSKKSRVDQHWENVSNMKWAVREWAETIAANNIRVDHRGIGVEEDIVAILVSKYKMSQADADNIGQWLRHGGKSKAGDFNGILARASKDLGNGDFQKSSEKPFLLGSTLAAKPDFVNDWNDKWEQYVKQADRFASEPSKVCANKLERTAAKWSREKAHVNLEPAKVVEARKDQEKAIAAAASIDALAHVAAGPSSASSSPKNVALPEGPFDTEDARKKAREVYAIAKLDQSLDGIEAPNEYQTRRATAAADAARLEFDKKFPVIKAVFSATKPETLLRPSAPYASEADRLQARTAFVEAKMAEHHDGEEDLIDGVADAVVASDAQRGIYESDFDALNPVITERKAIVAPVALSQGARNQGSDAEKSAVMEQIISLLKSQDSKLQADQIAKITAGLEGRTLTELRRDLDALKKNPTIHSRGRIEPTPAPQVKVSADPDLAQPKVVARILELERDLDLPAITDDGHQERVEALPRIEAQQMLKKLLAQKVLLAEESTLKRPLDSSKRIAQLEVTPQNARLEERLESLGIMKRLAEHQSVGVKDASEASRLYQTAITRLENMSVEQLREAEESEKKALREKIAIVRREHESVLPAREEMTGDVRDLSLPELQTKYEQLVKLSEDDDGFEDGGPLEDALQRTKAKQAPASYTAAHPLAPAKVTFAALKASEFDVSGALANGQSPAHKIKTPSAELAAITNGKMSLPEYMKPLPKRPESLLSLDQIPQVASFVGTPPSNGLPTPLYDQLVRGPTSPYYQRPFRALRAKTFLETNDEYRKALAIEEELEKMHSNYQQILSVAREIQSRPKDAPAPSDDENRIIAEAQKIERLYKLLNQAMTPEEVKALALIPVPVEVAKPPK